MKPEPNVTQLLFRAGHGDHAATDELFPVVYEELRRLAERSLAGESSAHTLQPTALVHEVYLRLVGPVETTWENRGHFFGAAARAIRRILTDHARARHRIKRGLGRNRFSLDHADAVVVTVDENLLALDSALTDLGELDPFKAKIVELRFFGGLSMDEIALSLGGSASTIAREWRFARAWLYRELMKETNE